MRGRRRDQRVVQTAAADALDQSVGTAIMDHELAALTGFDIEDVRRALLGLSTTYLDVNISRYLDGGIDPGSAARAIRVPPLARDGGPRASC